MMLQIIFLLCVLPSLITALELSDQDCTVLNRLPSLYEQYCCVEDNRGKTFILDNEDKIQYIMCPHSGTPTSCSSIDFSPSCSAILTSHPTATSGYYYITQTNGTVLITVYCNMDELCGDSGGWMRVGHLNMTEDDEACPTGFQTYDVDGIRSCGKHVGEPEGFDPPFCLSVNFPTYGVSYTQVCGRVTGYQKGSPDAFNTNSNMTTGQRGNIELAYVDGVSITRGSPRKHIWTYAASFRESILLCPCDEGSPSSATPPSFVGEDYFCETANHGFSSPFDIFFTDDLLWDGEQCGTAQAACCEKSRNMPWFKKVLNASTTDFLELRVCGDSGQAREDVGVNFYEFYVK